MSKIKIGSIAVYLLAFANLTYALMNGFEWLHFIAFGLTAIVLVFDIVALVRR